MQKRSSRHTEHYRMICRKSMSFISIQHTVKQLRRGFINHCSWEAKDGNGMGKAEDVWNLKGGHFSVLAGKGEPKKFWVALSYLKYPPFVKLLEAAEQEFGFDQPGVLIIPCEASELQRILSLEHPQWAREKLCMMIELFQLVCEASQTDIDIHISTMLPQDVASLDESIKNNSIDKP